MSHLIQITPTGEVTTLDWNDAEDSLRQLLRALSAEDVTVELLDAPSHARGEHITVWADDEGIANSGQLNVMASAYAGIPLVGTVVISGFDAETGDTAPLSPEEVAVERDHIVRATDQISARLSFLASLTGQL